jgi:outer membrane protein OmpA-like peptidoglycan-associated protein
MEIDKIAETLKAHPDARVDIEGYTDNVGRESSNVALSHARAAAVMNALKGMGVSIDRMTIEGHGSQGPIASNTTADGRAQNRRVQVEMSTH